MCYILLHTWSFHWHVAFHHTPQLFQGTCTHLVLRQLFSDLQNLCKIGTPNEYEGRQGLISRPLPLYMRNYNQSIQVKHFLYYITKIPSVVYCLKRKFSWPDCLDKCLVYWGYKVLIPTYIRLSDFLSINCSVMRTLGWTFFMRLVNECQVLGSMLNTSLLMLLSC